MKPPRPWPLPASCRPALCLIRAGGVFHVEPDGDGYFVRLITADGRSIKDQHRAWEAMRRAGLIERAGWDRDRHGVTVEVWRGSEVG